MADLDAGPEVESLLPEIGEEGETDVGELFRARYLQLVRLAGLLGADDPEDIAQEAFARLIRKRPPLSDADGALPYLRAIVCNLTRNRNRHLRVVRLRTPAGVDEESSEQAAILREDHREVLAALAKLPPRRREAIVLRYWLDLPEREIATTMGVSAGTVKSHVSRGLAALGQALEGKS
jgi:RNA polymerase sigma-70 factor (sigma-E family)